MRLVSAGGLGWSGTRVTPAPSWDLVPRRRVGCGPRRRLSGGAGLLQACRVREFKASLGCGCVTQACRVEEFEAFPPTARVCKKLVQFRKNGFSQVRLLANFEASHE